LTIYVEIPVELDFIQARVNTFEQLTIQMIQQTEKKILAHERLQLRRDRSRQRHPE
jgi:hypothetical protein